MKKKLANKIEQIESNVQKKKQMWYCEACGTDMNNKSKSSHNKTTTHIKIILVFRKTILPIENMYLTK